MIIKETTITKISIEDVPSLDNISLIIEEFEEGKAKVIIECYGKSWSASCGSMGGSLSEFFSRVNIQYLMGCFAPQLHPTTDTLDTEAMKETFVKEVRKKVKEMRQETYLNKFSARHVYNTCEEVGEELSAIAPEHPYDYWDFSKLYFIDKTAWKDVFYDKEDFTDWMISNVPEVYETNWNYDYLERILTVVKDVVGEEEKINEES